LSEIQIKTPNLVSDIIKVSPIYLKLKVSENLKQKFIKNLEPLEKSCQDIRDYRMASTFSRGNSRIHDILDPSLNCLDKSWIATEFINNKGKFIIDGQINNLNYDLYSELYVNIREIIEEVYPEINFHINLDRYPKLNVIIKIQSYQLQHDEHYTGEFHQEGFDEEGIIYVGIFYFRITDNICGGNLELRDNHFDVEKIKLKEKDFVFFLNKECEHRVGEISNKSEYLAERKILSYFIIDPSRTNIPTSKTVIINNKLSDLEKCIAYQKRIEFKKFRRVSNNYNDNI